MKYCRYYKQQFLDDTEHLVDVSLFCCTLYDVYVIVMQPPVASGVQQQVAKGHVCCDHFAPISREL